MTIVVNARLVARGRNRLVAIRPRLLRNVLVCGVAIASTAAGPAHAWEKDVHYGLTKWLALQVGFSAEVAERIAAGDQDIDDSMVTDPVVGTVLASCVGHDDPASSSVHDHHFASKVDPPAPAVDRQVVPGEVWEHGYLRPLPKLDPDRPNYTQLGQYLHAYQDSWSHQGTPDVPSQCTDVDRGWGHAIKRGGWSCHLADLTYKWRNSDAAAMAKGTYDVLVKARGGRSNTTWGKLEAAVDDFSKAETKYDKSRWFARDSRIDGRFLQVVSLPDCRRDNPQCTGSAFDQLIERWKRLPPQPQGFVGIPAAAIALIKDTLRSAVDGAKGAVLENVDRQLAAQALARALHVSGPCEPLYETLFDSMIGKAFRDGIGGQQPLAVCELAMQIQSGADSKTSCSAAVASAEAWLKDAMPRGPGLETIRKKYPELAPFAFFLAPGNAKDEYWAFANFIHLPADQLVMGVNNIGGRYKITSLIWQPDEGLARRPPPQPIRVSSAPAINPARPPADLAVPSDGIAVERRSDEGILDAWAAGSAFGAEGSLLSRLVATPDRLASKLRPWE